MRKSKADSPLKTTFYRKQMSTALTLRRLFTQNKWVVPSLKNDVLHILILMAPPCSKVCTILFSVKSRFSAAWWLVYVNTSLKPWSQTWFELNSFNDTSYHQWICVLSPLFGNRWMNMYKYIHIYISCRYVGISALVCVHISTCTWKYMWVFSFAKTQHFCTAFFCTPKRLWLANLLLWHMSHGPLARYVNLRVRMRRECRERFPRHRG